MRIRHLSVRMLLPVSLTLALLLLSIHPLFAEAPIHIVSGVSGGGESEGGGESGGNPFTLLKGMEPIKDLVSGSVWLMAQGIDQRAFVRAPEHIVDPFQLPGAQSPLASSSYAPLGQGAGPGVLVPYRDPAPAFSRNLLVTRDFSSRTLQTEPSLVVDPQDPDHLVLGTIDYNFPSNSVYVSIDGGKSWDGPKQTKYLRDDLGSGGDPVLAFDKKGTVYITSISIGVKDYSIGSASGEALVSSIAVAASDDGGSTWQEPVSSATSTVETNVKLDDTGHVRGTISLSFLDKPWIATGPHPTIEGQEMIYVSYTKFTSRYEILYIGELPVLGIPETLTTPEMVTSADGGQTWSDPVAVGPTVRSVIGEGNEKPGGGSTSDSAVSASIHLDQGVLAPGGQVISAEDGDYRAEVIKALSQRTQIFQDSGKEEGKKRTIQGVVPVVDSKGIVYVAWLDSTDDEAMKGLGEFYMAKSEDGGVKFADPVRIASFLEPPYRARTAFFRYWASAFPKLAIGPKDDLYVAYTALPPENAYDEGDIFLIRSTDGGKRWSRPKKLNQDEGSSVQFFPAITVGSDDKVHVMWGDMRDDAVGTRYHIYYTTSEDQGETWGFKNDELNLQVGDTRVTDFATNPNKAFPSGAFIGDYFAIAATDKEAYMVWPDGRLGEYGGVNQKIAFARQRSIPSPEIFISPNAGPGGETVTVQGHGYQADMTYYLTVGGQTVASGRTNSEGVITANVFVPISGEGGHPIALVDESGNFAATDFYMEFGFDSIKKELDSLGKQINASSTVTASNSVVPAAPQLVSNKQATVDVGRLASLEQEVSTLKAQQAVQQMAQVQPVVAGGFLGGRTSLALGLTGLTGLLLGVALAYVRMAARRE